MSAPVFLISGDDLLAHEALGSLRAELGADPLSEASFDPTSPPAEIIAALETPSLLGGRRVVVVHDGQALSKEHVDALAAYLRSPAPHAVLVLLASGRAGLTDAVRATGSVLTLEAPKGRRLVGWIRERARRAGLRVDDRGAWALLDSVGPELRSLDAAIQQLATSGPEGGRVGATEVRSLFPRLAEERVYAFTDAVGDRRLDVSMGALRRLLEQGDEPLVLFGALAAQIRRLLIARGLAEGSARAVGDALGLPEWRAERLHRQARSYREDELAAALGVLAEADVEMKGGDVPPEVALERAVIRIVAHGRA